MTSSIRAPAGPRRSFASARSTASSVALEQHFDAAVGEVPHPAMQALDRRLRLGEGAKADTLNAAADQILPRDLHEQRL